MQYSPAAGARNVPGREPGALNAEPTCGSPTIDASRPRQAVHTNPQPPVGGLVTTALGKSPPDHRLGSRLPLILTRARAHNSRGTAGEHPQLPPGAHRCVGAMLSPPGTLMRWTMWWWWSSRPVTGVSSMGVMADLRFGVDHSGHVRACQLPRRSRQTRAIRLPAPITQSPATRPAQAAPRGYPAENLPATSLPLTVTMHGLDRRAADLARRLQAVAGGRVTESSGGVPRYGSISTRASWPVQPWLRVEEGRSAVSTLGLP